MLGYLISGIASTIKNYKLSLILLVVVQVFSVIVIIFSYGIVNHYNTKIDEPESVELCYEFNRNKSNDVEENKEYMDIAGTKLFFQKVLPVIEDKVDYFFVLGWYNGYIAMSSTGYEDGRYTISSQLKKRTWIENGEGFTEDEIANGEKCILAGEDLIDDSGYVTLSGKEYKVKGVLKTAGLENAFYVPYLALPMDIDVIQLTIFVDKPLLKSEYDVISSALEECFGDKVVIPEFKGYINESNNKVYRDIILVSVLLIFVFAIDYCIIYRYLLEKRKRLFAISRICGASTKKIGCVYMIELLGVSAITLLSGVWIFHVIVLPRIKSFFEYIDLYCKFNTYVKLGNIYMIILFVVYFVLIVRFVRQTPVSLMKEV